MLIENGCFLAVGRKQQREKAFLDRGERFLKNR
jgi:hypothetical protein